jgi:putative hemolysin
MQRGNLDRLCVFGVLILGGIHLMSCSTPGGAPMAGPSPVVSVSTASREMLPTDSNIEPFPTRSLVSTESSPSVSCENVSISNPAATYCSLLGYQSGTKETAEGQVSTCTMPDGTVCDAWQFLRGTCGQEFSWCALNGYQIQNVIESDGLSTQEYAVCVDASGNTVGTLFELSGLQAMLEACSRR